jgi:hypothetical protein
VGKEIFCPETLRQQNRTSFVQIQRSGNRPAHSCSDDEINFILNHPDSTLFIKKRSESGLSPQSIIEELEDILKILQSSHRISGSAVQSSFDKPLT